MIKSVKIDDIKFDCIDPESCLFEVKWGDTPSECTHVFYEHHPFTDNYWFSFEDEDYPNISFGYIHNPGFVNNGSDDPIVDAMKTFLIGYLVGANKITLKDERYENKRH